MDLPPPPHGGAGAPPAQVHPPAALPLPLPMPAMGFPMIAQPPLPPYPFQRGFDAKYTRGGVLGRGASGVVYECALTPAGLAARGGRPLPPIAVKRMSITYHQQLEMLKRECAVWVTLAHNGIVQLVEAFLDDDREVAGAYVAWIVMERPPLVRALPAGPHGGPGAAAPPALPGMGWRDPLAF
jgi:hypothetical protein